MSVGLVQRAVRLGSRAGRSWSRRSCARAARPAASRTRGRPGSSHSGDLRRRTFAGVGPARSSVAEIVPDDRPVVGAWHRRGRWPRGARADLADWRPGPGLRPGCEPRRDRGHGRDRRAASASASVTRVPGTIGTGSPSASSSAGTRGASGGGGREGRRVVVRDHLAIRLADLVAASRYARPSRRAPRVGLADLASRLLHRPPRLGRGLSPGGGPRPAAHVAAGRVLMRTHGGRVAAYAGRPRPGRHRPQGPDASIASTR